jgi:hypothetical protein
LIPLITQMKYLFFLPMVIGLSGCVPIQQSTTGEYTSERLLLEDHIYEEQVRSVRIYPVGTAKTEVINPAVALFGQPSSLVLEFDDLVEDVDNYYVYIIHCNANWSKSSLTDLEFMVDFNEFVIDQYEYSFNTKTPYVTYRFMLPTVKLPGNYVLVVYRNPNKDDLVLTRRFLVVSNTVEIAAKGSISTGIAQRRTHQQIDFSIHYGKYEILNPYQDVKVAIRQNQKWFNAITDLRPTSIREDISQLVYQHFNLENNFKAGNQYRYFDLRSVSFTGINVERIAEERGVLNAFLMRDRPRTGAYSAYNDINGKYVLENVEPRKTYTESEYLKVHFFLAKEEPIKFDIYIMGELSNWTFTQDNRMAFNPELKGYTGSLLLKQGWYNYQYYVPGAEDPFMIEGNHYETENQYEIIVYHRPVGSRADMIIGYRSLIMKI